MEKPKPIFSTEAVLSGTTELLRCLIIALLGKRMLSYQELDLAIHFAKDRLDSDVYDVRVRKAACAYVDLVRQSLNPEPPEPAGGQYH